MLDIIRSVASVLTVPERKRALIVLLMSILLGMLEAAGVASIMPFLAVVGNPDIIQRVPPLAWAYETLGFTSTNAFLVALGIASVCVLVFTSMFRLLTNWVQLRFVSMRRHTISRRLLETFLRQPYAFFLNRNSADLSKGILAEANEVINQVLKPLVETISYGVVALALIGFLVYLDPLIALAVAGTLSASYAGVYYAIRGFTRTQGQDRVTANKQRFAAVNEAFGGIKEVKLRGLESFFLKRFDEPSKIFARTQATNAIVSQTPRFIIEAVAFGVIMAVTIVLIATKDDLGSILPLLGAYVLAGYKLLPAMQNVYKGSVTVRFGMGALDSLVSDLALDTAPLTLSGKRTTPLVLEQGLRMEAVRYTYPQSEKPAIHDLHLSIPANTTVGFVGSTGAGKSTAVDLILGLLNPTGGRILIDGKAMSEIDPRAWQQAIGYVPQAIYLADASISANIAFGIPEGEVDQAAVERAARAAQLHEFIANQLPQGYATQVGERGVRLSGGQRQRIGIARALYHDPQILVLDEGTSALDSLTEAAVMESIRGLAHQKTIILIAHRLSTVRECDQIFLMEQGELKGTGSYEQLQRENETFRRLANTSEAATA